jgi:hypothetical protein
MPKIHTFRLLERVLCAQRYGTGRAQEICICLSLVSCASEAVCTN